MPFNALRQRQASPSRVPVESPLAFAPADLLIDIASFLETRLDVLNFCLTSSHVFSNVSAVLYESVVLESVDQCRLTLRMLSRRIDIARHVRKLVIRPQVRHVGYFTPADSSTASAAVRNIASAKCLDALVSFQWDADELPFYDDMWFALRIGCPQLRSVGTSLGLCLPKMNSHLFDFQDLSEFSLYLKHGFYEGQVNLLLDEDHSIFKKFWDMLINRCPNLEGLTVEGYSNVPIDLRFLVEGRWPRLRKLVLGDVCVDWFPRTLNSGEKRPFVTFLEAHPELETLSMSRCAIQPVHFNTLDIDALSRVTHFSGTHQQLHALQHVHRSIKSVVFRDPVETRDVSAPTVASLLRELTSLESLKISFMLHSMYDSGHLLRSLIQSCPTLRHLELTCAHKPSFQLDSFAKTIRGFPKLRSLHLTIVKYPGDETILSGAIRIAQSNPRLQKFSLTFIPPVYPVPLPFSVPYRPFPFSFIPVHATGLFEVSCDQHGLPLSMSAVERSTFVWPWGLGVSYRAKKYCKDLRPPGCPALRRTGVRGFLSLLFERSSAGEEIRMILFCAFLAFLAGCGVLCNGANNHNRSTLSTTKLIEELLVA
ncbi:hypothetical protein CPB84DRAFT_1782886 [Gymnopilus junonius]|uniref:F-box domain-containing protein n=1 Tax=Gymnopilus junonius TaxID=109634 RepID=A0A9P5NI72_GYMJU|nr:hypothetical protein CPB84DRAFT_1782886 [Gymnopilus junonius]